MVADSGTPLASTTDFKAGPFANMAVGMLDPELNRTLIAATRDCETMCRKRLAPFTNLVESVRLQDGDVEDIIPVGLPLPMQAQMGLDYARALAMPALVRGFEVRNFPVSYPDMWTGSIGSIQIAWPVQTAPYVIPAQAIQFFPDTGLGNFNVGAFVPPGSTGIITYSGGYSTVPEDLRQACLVMAAAIIARELDPVDGMHDPNVLRETARGLLEGFGARRARR